MLDTIQESGPAAWPTLIVVVNRIAIRNAEFKDRRHFGIERDPGRVANIVSFRPQRSSGDATRIDDLGLLRGDEIVRHAQLVAFGEGVIEFEINLVTVIGRVFLPILVVAHPVLIAEPDQGLVEGDVDSEGRAEFEAPTVPLLSLGLSQIVIIIEAAQCGRDRPQLGSLLRRQTGRVRSLYTGDTERG